LPERELSIQYRNPARRIAVAVGLVSLPFWAFFGPATLGLVIAGIATGLSPFSMGVAAVACFLLLAIICGGMMTMAFSEDNRILVSSEGLTFPMMMSLRLRWKRNRVWSELLKVDVFTDDRGCVNRLVLTFRDGSVLPLRVASVEAAALEQFLVAIELWAPEAERSIALSDFQSKLQNRSVGLDSLSYTKIWEEELGRRFSATTFVPLEPDRLLQSGKYKIVRQIAFGGFSAVYLAQRNDLDMVILKQAVLPPETDEKVRSAAEHHLRRESEILSRLDHPGIVKIFDFFVEEGNYYLVMEHVSGQDLRQLVKQHGAQAPGRVLEWAEQIATTLEFLHSQTPPIVHRDASPDNIVIANDGTVRLIDFGASTEFVTNATGTIIGKQAYTAPEQLRGKACGQSDIYALGATMYFCLTGTDPLALSASHPRQVIQELSQPLDELVSACTAFELADRVPTMAIVKTRLHELQDKPQAVKVRGA